MSLILNDVSKSFGTYTLFTHLSYATEQTGMTKLVAPSGKGKTTLLRMIAGLDTDYTGTIEGGGIERVSICFQEYRLFPACNALDNVRIGAPSETKRAQELLIQLGFTPGQTRLFADALSGGMKQRVALARAFLRPAPLLLLDEPCKELDGALREKVLCMIAEESSRRTVIVTAHSDRDVALPGARVLAL